MTLRQLFSQWVCIVAIKNSTSEYKRISSIMTKARNDGRIEFRCMVDRSRPEYRPSVFDDAQEYAEVVKEGYHKDYWQLQPQRVELWTEKDTIIGSIEKLTRELELRCASPVDSCPPQKFTRFPHLSVEVKSP